MRDLLFFDVLVTPKIITFIYWFFLLAAIVGGIGAMFGANFFAGLFGMVLGVIGARIWCELLIVLFKINENIARVADSGSAPPAE